MRYPCFVLTSATALALFALSPASAEKSFPYVAFVNQSESPIRSGPANEFYETDRLEMGAEVEVYRHDGDQWCAIRPPAQSFSWVPGEHLELTANPTLARVVHASVKTRVGSRFNDIHDVEYISLIKGELLEILGSDTLHEASDDAPRQWYKVAPPAGEFRWMHKSHLSRQPTSQINDSANTYPPNDSTADASEATAAQQIQTFPLTDSLLSSEPHDPIASQSTFTAGNQDGVAHATALSSHLDNRVETTVWRAVGTPETLLTGPEPRSFADRHGTLNLMLSQAVLVDLSYWDLDAIQQQVVLLVQQAESLNEQRQAETLLAKIGEFQRLQARHRRLSEPSKAGQLTEPGRHPQNSTDVIGSPYTPEMPRLISRYTEQLSAKLSDSHLELATAEADIFDATGRLITVRGTRQGLPKFALTDTQGRVLQFVSAEGNVNLSQYLNKRVGIVGKAGYLRQFKKPHLTARRVVTLYP